MLATPFGDALQSSDYLLGREGSVKTSIMFGFIPCPGSKRCDESTTTWKVHVVSDIDRIASFWRDFDYSDGILSPKDKGRTVATLRSILQLLEHGGSLTFEQIANGLDCDEKSLEILLNGGIMGGLFEVLPNGKYTIKK